jgi:hypothetical protein
VLSATRPKKVGEFQSTWSTLVRLHWSTYREFFENEHGIAEGTLKMAKKSGINEFSDPFDFVKASLPEDGEAFFQEGIVPDIPYLGKDIIKNLEAAHSTLSAIFWFSLVTRKVEIAPLEHRILLVQLQNYLNYSRFAFRARRKYAANPTLKDRMLQIHEVVTTVSPKYLKKEERVCNICMVPFDGNEKGISRDKQ